MNTNKIVANLQRLSKIKPKKLKTRETSKDNIKSKMRTKSDHNIEKLLSKNQSGEMTEEVFSNALSLENASCKDKGQKKKPKTGKKMELKIETVAKCNGS